ncbi:MULTISPECIES: sugar ABC transporter ATP-binding protein [unclassified Mesorhizobium]|uniref:sugar ABC transporter ATP-binding protein n=1 Tax=unclassified Mesorhizobium TaxID=325217 RepID=UPI000FCC5A6D|nr:MULTISPECIES: sugar ABC transporter ATP-binding protein [unclassified Mesorhizobium]RUX06136.1 sugar ABC transporter ATP-binding protein [Mesorhizobium sp. M8A.F.Ca.ET.023.01.1.1]RWC74310.1 MAG: sugar ABC transporter ATP-binding protein [Mesorhizobium sp.]TGV15293.1 sugar ABC transporter ATP-binding protein [Mesorhizobium sp. M8A.F.Ca.ET.173.01.1.1]RUW44255.1 sugar ABC transporter ATP-binding protein [Mesorhizobium sp. M8A.F.Ca.ET.021.01.1.1]TGT38048.1 sugar ABC transporter ATP-binding prot
MSVDFLHPGEGAAIDTDVPALELRGIDKRFPGVVALDNVDFTLKPGKIHALMGENGAGKSTLIKIMAGVYGKDAGTIRMRGREVDIQSPRDSLKEGIKVVFQEIALISEFTVAENIFLEGYPTGRAGSIDWKKIRADSAALFNRIGFNVDPAARTGSLPVSQQQMVEIARALAHEARVVVMDEPTSSLTPNEVSLLFTVIRRLASLGIAVVYVSHKLDEVFEIADTVTVLRDGRHISTKPIGEHSNDTLIQDMIGRRIDNLFPRQRGAAGGKVALSVEKLSTARKLDEVSFEARAGEVLGFFGLMGAGRTELAKAIVGYDPITAGTISVDGQRLTPHDTRTGVRLGIGLLTEDRKSEGLMGELPVYQNASLASLGAFARMGLIDTAKEHRAVQDYVDRFRIKTPSLFQQVKNLSGGNQQKVLISRWLMRGLKVIVVDEPTRGIDVGAKSEIFALIDRLAGEGLAVVMMTSEMPELLGLADRIAVMCEGRLTAIMSRDEATQEKILNAAIG